jgi:hypothetical protein
VHPVRLSERGGTPQQGVRGAALDHVRGSPPPRPLTATCCCSALPETERTRLAPLLALRTLGIGEPLIEPGEAVTELVFPIGAVASMLADSAQGMSVEAGTIGREGVVGSAALLGIERMALRTTCQI